VAEGKATESANLRRLAVSDENEELLERFQEALRNYDHMTSEQCARELLEQGENPVKLAATLTEMLGSIGDEFAAGTIYLPELVLASRAGQAAMSVVEKALASSSEQVERRGTIVIGTVKGDVHDIGKNIVATLFFAAGFEVKDLGTDVTPEAFVQAVKDHSPDVLAMSALLTTTMGQQRTVVQELEKAGLDDEVKVIVGGAPVTAEFAAEIGADGYGDNAFDAVDLVKALAAEAEVKAV
jgi:5-methyltetrahydrofolate--homocysteine methyltransferase